MCEHRLFTTTQDGMWNYDTCHDCGANGPRYPIEDGMNDDKGSGYFAERRFEVGDRVIVTKRCTWKGSDYDEPELGYEGEIEKIIGGDYAMLKGHYIDFECLELTDAPTPHQIEAIKASILESNVRLNQGG